MSYYADRGNKYSQVPELEFDFHGYTTFECQEVIDDLINNHKYSHVRFIVGKGINSINGPVLPDFVKNYLTSHDIRFNQSKIQNGGEGALEVYFKKML